MPILSKRTLCLLRAIIPTWKFFEEFNSVSKLEYRVREASLGSGEFGSWQVCLTKKYRGFGSFLLNPQGNLLLAQHDLVNQLVADLEDVDESDAEKFAETVSYRLVQRMVEEKSGTSEFQFRVLLVSANADGLETEEVLISKVHSSQ